MTNSRIGIEVCVDDVEGAARAAAAGADRLELAAGLREGGLTPSLGLIRAVRAAVRIPIIVLLRPRGGDFLYSAAEQDLIVSDLKIATEASVDGFAVGALRADGRLDAEFLQRLADAARPLALTCHRAFDFTPDLTEALETLIALGFDRVLTSGGNPRAPDATETIHALVAQSRGRIGILPGGGIRAGNVRALVEATGVREVHLSATDWRPFAHPASPGLSVDGPTPPAPHRTKLTSAQEIVDVRAALTSTGAGPI